MKRLSRMLLLLLLVFAASAVLVWAASPAARQGDMHVCPIMVPVPHVGGPILPPCCPTVIIGGMPAARVDDLAQCAGAIDVIATGSPTVIIGGRSAARKGDATVHGGMITQGCATVIIGP